MKFEYSNISEYSIFFIIFEYLRIFENNQKNIEYSEIFEYSNFNSEFHDLKTGLRSKKGFFALQMSQFSVKILELFYYLNILILKIIQKYLNIRKYSNIQKYLEIFEYSKIFEYIQILT